MRPAALLIAALVATAGLSAHPEIEDALERLNALIKATPIDADLFLERGDLYARHEEWVAAEANYLTAAEIAPRHPGIARSRGALALALRKPQEARPHLDDAVAGLPNDPHARLLRARALAALDERRSAVADLDAALALVVSPSPELFLLKASLLAPDAAIRALDEGIARIGPVPVLQLRAAALEESLGHIDAAAQRLDLLAAGSERQELWLQRKGDLFARAGRTEDARAAYTAAIAAIANLPEWLRASPETVTLSRQLSSFVQPSSIPSP